MTKTCTDCEIGIWHDYDYDRTISFKELKELSISSAYKIEDYVDRRKSVNLSRFNYCPVCGKKIELNKKNKKNKNYEI